MLEQARELGIALAGSQEFIRMKQAQAAVEKNEAVGALIDELKQKRSELVTILSGTDTDGTLALSLTNDIERLQGQLSENPMFVELIESESAFSALISAVDDEINACIGATKNSCGGNCESCGGCKH